MSRLLSFVTPAALLLAAPLAQAQVASFDSSLADVRFGVIDLAPNDGQAAEFAYQLLSSEYKLRVWDGGASAPATLQDTTSGTAAVDYSLSSTNGDVQVQATGLPGEISVAGLSPGRSGANASAYQVYEFTLAPHSALTLTARAEQQVTRLQRGGQGASWFTIRMSNDEDGRNQLLSEDIFSFYPRFDPPSPVHQSLERDVWLSYGNDTDDAATVRVAFEVGVSAIPEPSTYLMLATGLIGLGAAVRRRASRA